MNFRFVKKILCLAALFLNVCFRPLSEEQALPAENEKIPKGLELCFSTEKKLEDAGYTITKRELSSTGFDTFPFNILLDFPAETADASESPQNLIIDITQEDFFRHSDAILKLIRFTEEKKFSYSVEFLFTTLDENDIHLANFPLTGTENFASSSVMAQNSIALILDFENENSGKEKKAKIFTTGAKKSSPLWLTKLLAGSFNEEKIPFETPQKLLSLYRSALLFGDIKISSFFKNDVAAIKCGISGDDDLRAVRTFLANFESTTNFSGESHYFFTGTHFNRTFFLSERTNILALELFGTLGLLILIIFTFSGKKRIRYKKAFLNYWYFIPLTLAVSVLSLELAQTVFKKMNFFYRSNPLILFGGKIIFSAVFISILFAVFGKITNFDGNFIFGYLVSFVSIANVFFFSVVDITLFWLFLFEYAVVYISKNIRRKAFLALSAVFMIAPFFPYLFHIFLSANNFELRRILFSSFAGNLLFALILFPFQIMRLRFLSPQKNEFKTKIMLKKNILHVFASVFIISAVSLLSIEFFNHFAYQKNPNASKTLKITAGEAESFSAKVDFAGKKNYSTETLTIRSEKQALRYEVSIFSEESLPVFDSIYDFKVRDNSKRVDFLLPDMPPEKITIDFTPDAEANHRILISAYYEDGENALRKEILSIERQEGR